MFGLYKKKNNKYLIINKKINAGIPFKWEYEIEDEDIVQFVDSKVLKSKLRKPICGGPIYTDYYFKGLKQGSTKIIFKFVSITKEMDPIIEEYEVIVDENNNINLEGVINNEKKRY